MATCAAGRAADWDCHQSTRSNSCAFDEPDQRIASCSRPRVVTTPPTRPSTSSSLVSPVSVPASFWSGAAAHLNAPVKERSLEEVMKTVDEVFYAFCKARQHQHDGEHRGMSGRTFAQLVTGCHLIDRHFSTADADLIFAKVAQGPGHNIELQQFKTALNLVAEKNNIDVVAVLNAVADSEGPSFHSSTKWDRVRLHYNWRPHRDFKEPMGAFHQKSLKRKSPSRRKSCEFVPGWRHPHEITERLSSWIDELPNDRARRHASLAADHKALAGSPSRSLRRARAASAPHIGIWSVVNAQHLAKILRNRDRIEGTPAEPSEPDLLFEAFKKFCSKQDPEGIDCRGFEEFCRQCILLNTRFTVADARTIFTTVATAGEPCIGVEQFKTALQLIAQKKRAPENNIRWAVEISMESHA